MVAAGGRGQCEGLDEGCTYRQLTQTPFGKEEMKLLIENRDELRNLRIRCLNTGTFVRFDITDAQGGTFVDGEMGMDPQSLRTGCSTRSPGGATSPAGCGSTLEALREAAAEGRGRSGRSWTRTRDLVLIRDAL